MRTLNLVKQEASKPNFKILDENLKEIKDIYNSINLNDCTGKELFEELMSFQDEDGSFKLINTFQIDKDARIEYCFLPTYYITAIMIEAYLIKEDYYPGLKDVLSKALVVCTYRGLSNGEYMTDEYKENFEIFNKKGVKEFVKAYPNLCFEFTKMMKYFIDFYK